MCTLRGCSVIGLDVDEFVFIAATTVGCENYKIDSVGPLTLHSVAQSMDWIISYFGSE